jgi:hypothetical protein
MATPIKEDIAANLLTTINTVTTGNSYQQTITGIRTLRIDYAKVSPDDLTFILSQDEEEEAEPGHSKKTWIQNYTVLCVVVDSDDSTTAIETRINQVEADIRKAVRVDPQRNSNALDTIINPSTQLPDGVDFTGIIVNIAVHYRHSEDDPYTA